MADIDEAVAAVLDRVAADDSCGVAAALRGMNETRRRAVWKALSARRLATRAGAVAVLGSAPGAKSAADRSWVAAPAQDAVPFAVQVLAERRPAWLEDLAARLVDPDSASGWGFPLVRALVRDGVIDEPDGPDLLIAMVHGLVPWSFRQSGLTVLDGLRQDPGLLDDAIWRLLRTEIAGRRLATNDRFLTTPYRVPGREPTEPRPDSTWRSALITLAAEDAIDRDRLLDATLHAMLADWAAADVEWFIGLHDALVPTDDELATRAPTYLRLLASETGTVVKVGLRAATRLLDGGAVGPGALAPALRPTLLRTQKGTAMAALKLLARLGEGDPAGRDLITDVARLGLDHPRADVREQARGLVERWLPHGELEALEVHAPLPAAAPPLLAEPEPVAPLADADELAELLAHLIEEADDPVAVERALDGVLRFGKARPAGADALALRARERLHELHSGPWSGQELRADLAAVAPVWLRVARPGPGYLGRTVRHDYTRRSSAEFSTYEVKKPDWSLPALMSIRFHEVAVGIRNGPAGLLSLPTSSDGSLAAAVLNQRLQRWRAAPPLDLGLALLRVAPAELGELRLPRLMRGRDAAAGALKMLTTHRPTWHRVIGPTTGLYTSRPVAVVGWADPASPVGAPERLVAAVLDRRAPLDRAGLEANDGEDMMRPEQVTAMWPLMLPHHVDHLAAHAHPRLARALDKNRSGAVPVVEAIGRSPHRGGAPTWSTLALALAAKDPAVRTAAIDAFIIRARRDLLDATGVGEQIRLCLSDELVVGTRIVDCLAEAARADPTSAMRALDVLAVTLDALAGRRDAHRWIELLANLTNDLSRPVPLPQAYSDLARSADRSVLAKACRRVRAAG